MESEEFCRLTAALTAEFESFVNDELEIKENGSGERKVIDDEEVVNELKIKENGDATRAVCENAVETKITKEVQNEPEVKERHFEVVVRKTDSFDVNGNIETSQESEKSFLTKASKLEEKREVQIVNKVSKVGESSQETYNDGTSSQKAQNFQQETIVDHNSREETPDYIPMTVREKFHALRIDENGNEQHKTKVVQSVKFKESSNEPTTASIEKSEESRTEIIENSNKIDSETIQNPKRTTTATIETTFMKVVPSPRAKKREKVEQGVLEETERHFEELAAIKVEAEESSERNETNFKKLDQVSVEDDSRKFAQTEDYKKLAQDYSLEKIETKSPEIEEINSVKNDTYCYQDELIRRKSLETPIMFHESIEECVLRNREPPVPPQRRRSVKDIIESINRSQKLLKPNQSINSKFDSQFQCDGVKPPVPPKTNALFLLQRQAESEKRINALLADLHDYNK